MESAPDDPRPVIVVVDDDMQSRERLERCLQIDMDARTASSPRVAVHRAEATRVNAGHRYAGRIDHRGPMDAR